MSQGKAGKLTTEPQCSLKRGKETSVLLSEFQFCQRENFWLPGAKVWLSLPRSTRGNFKQTPEVLGVEDNLLFRITRCVHTEQGSLLSNLGGSIELQKSPALICAITFPLSKPDRWTHQLLLQIQTWAAAAPFVIKLCVVLQTCTRFCFFPNVDYSVQPCKAQNCIF